LGRPNTRPPLVSAIACVLSSEDEREQAVIHLDAAVDSANAEIEGMQVDLLWTQHPDGETGRLDLSSEPDAVAGFGPVRVVLPLDGLDEGGAPIVHLFEECDGTIYELICEVENSQ
jgi:hypothetical protein